MKLLRPILIITGILFLLGIIAVGLALVPSLQRWAILRAAAKHPELHLKLGSISADFSSMTAHGVELEQRGVKVTFDGLEAEYSLWAFLVDRHVEIRRLHVQGLMVDASKLSSGKTQAGLAAAPAGAPGALAQVKLPWQLTVDEIKIQGRVLMAAASGGSPMDGEFTLSGGRIGPGRDGEIKIKTRLKDPAPKATVTALDALVTLQLRESLQQTFDRIHLTTLLDATGPELAGPNQLKFVAEMTRAATGENYHVLLDTLRGGQSENVLTLNAALLPEDSSYKGEWTLAARSSQLEPFMLGRPLPTFDANGGGQFLFAPATSRANVQGALKLAASDFDKLRPELKALGALQVKTDFNVTTEAGLIRINKGEVALTSEQPVLELRTTGSPAFNVKQRRFEPGPGAGEIARLKIAGIPLAWLTPYFPAAAISGGPISGEISLVQREGVAISLQTITPLQADGVTVLVAGRTVLAKTAVKIDAEADLSATRAQAKIRSLTMKTAAGDSLQATASVIAPKGLQFPLEVAADFTADLPALVLPLLPAAPVKAKGSLGLNWQTDRIEVLRFAVESTDAKGQLLGSAALSRSFIYNLAQNRAETGGANEVPLASLKLGQLPLVTLPRFFGDYTLSGRLAGAEATIAAVDGKLTLRTTAPISILDFSVLQKKKTLLDRLKLELQPVVEIDHGSLTQLQTGQVTLLAGIDTRLAELNVGLIQSKSGMLAVSSFTVDLPALATQPALTGADALSSGQASGELRAALGGGGAQIEARATLNGLVASDGGQTLPVANVSLRADVEPNGRFSFQSPVLLDRAGQRSDFRLSGEGALTPAGISLDGKLASEHIELPDLLLLLAMAGSPVAAENEQSAAAQSRALSPPAADLAPFWRGLNGQFTLECKSVVKGHEWSMTGLNGRVIVSAEQLQLENLQATFDEKSQLTAKGGLAFTDGLNPYHLKGDFSLTAFDTGRFFKAIEPERAPAIEGLLTIKGQLEGQGLTLGDTLDRARGSFDLTSRQGMFRGLKRSGDKLSMAAKAVGIVSSLLGDNAAEKLTGPAFYVDQLGQEVGEISFDQFTARLVRDASLNLHAETITLVAQQIHLVGSGQITHVAGQPLLNQPLQATFSLRTRGKIEEVLGKLKDLDGTRDQLGYAKAKTPVTIGGTLARPNPGPYFVQLGLERVGEKLNEPAPANP